jgi:hypothetical protein
MDPRTLERILTPRQIANGLAIREDDHTVCIVRGGLVQMRFMVTAAHPTLVELQEYADLMLAA